MVVLEALSAFAARSARFAAGVFICTIAVLLSGCASLWPQTAQLREGLPSGLPERVELKSVPFFPQTEYHCGPAALATLIAGTGMKVTPDSLAPQVYLPGRQGSLQVEMMAAARRHGLVSYQLAPRFEDLLREVASGTPVIVLQNLGLVDGWHYAVAVGYDYESGELILRSGETERKVLPFTLHEFVWRRGEYWAMVAMPPDRIPVTARESPWLSAVAALERAGGPRAARTAYVSFLKRWPHNTGAAIGLANTHHSLGELREAESVLREALKREPDAVIALNNLAQTLSDQGRHQEALPVIERAAANAGPFAKAIGQTRQTILDRLRGQAGGVQRPQ